ncbi:MAG TPA: metallophosphoesterase [Thermoanaerobaculaceae bacterium]|nr:metallophosphoesterase [Thermoanaerobaculaceae bacterium]
MFWQMVMLAWTVMCGYAVWRASTVPFLCRRLSRRTTVLIGLLLWASAFAARSLGHEATGPLARAAGLAGITLMAALFLVAVSMLIVDVLTAFGFLLSRLAPRLRGWALLAGLGLSAVALVQGLRPPVVSEHEVRLPGLPAEADGTVIVALSDLHLGATLGAPWMAARVAQVQALRPDLVVLIGDILEGHPAPTAALLVSLRTLAAPLGVWAVTGNHEFHGGRDQSPGPLEAVGLRVLHDEWVEVRPGLVLAGIDDLTSRRRLKLQDEAMTRALSGHPPGGVVLLSHTPWQVQNAANEGAGLMLSGHTHGGQIWPFGILVRALYPYLGGRYQVGSMSLIVSRGTGTWGPRMRLWRPSEILRITLRAAPPTAR